ncbi:uncharacterized protein LOC144367550 [Ictidomys tridecemlineatus]
MGRLGPGRVLRRTQQAGPRSDLCSRGVPRPALPLHGNSFRTPLATEPRGNEQMEKEEASAHRLAAVLWLVLERWQDVSREKWHGPGMGLARKQTPSSQPLHKSTLAGLLASHFSGPEGMKSFLKFKFNRMTRKSKKQR